MTLANYHFNLTHPQRDRLSQAAKQALQEALNLQPNEKILIMSNPSGDLPEIAKAVYNTALDLNANPVLMFQPSRSRLDLAEPSTLSAISSNPDVLFTITERSLGNDPNGLKNPYRLGQLTFNHIFYYLIASKKARGAWCPGVNADIFCRTVPINYTQMWDRAKRLKRIFDRSTSLHITTPGGTDLVIDLNERDGMLDDGDYRYPGSGGNLPAGEVFAVPNTGSNGIAVIDGSASVVDGTLKVTDPVKIVIENGKLVSFGNSNDAKAIANTIEQMRQSTEEQIEQGIITKEQAEIYRSNCNNLAEIGIGLNPAAKIHGNMTEDEKVFNTCHIAVGDDCYGIAPAIDHFDLVMMKPTFEFTLDDGSRLKVDPKNPPESA